MTQETQEPTDTKQQEPTFRAIFGDSWNDLPAVMLKHYRNRPYSTDSYRVSGTMTVETAPILRLFAPLSRLFGGIPLVNARDIPVTVDFTSEPDGRAFHFIRLFHLGGGKPYRFHSRMVPRGGNRVVEVMKSRLGWCVRFVFEDERVKLKHDGYALCLFGRFIPLPLGWLVGHVNAEEWETGDNRFDMYVDIQHPIFGKIYEYRGSFSTEAIPPLENADG